MLLSALEYKKWTVTYTRGISIEIYNEINSLSISRFLCSEKNCSISVFLPEHVGTFHSSRTIL